MIQLVQLINLFIATYWNRTDQTVFATIFYYLNKQRKKSNFTHAYPFCRFDIKMQFSAEINSHSKLSIFVCMSFSDMISNSSIKKEKNTIPIKILGSQNENFERFVCHVTGELYQNFKCRPIQIIRLHNRMVWKCNWDNGTAILMTSNHAIGWAPNLRNWSPYYKQFTSELAKNALWLKNGSIQSLVC